MKKLIPIIKNALEQKTNLLDYLNKNTTYTWQENYPIAVIHEQKRVKDSKTLEKMQEYYFFDDEGFSQEKYTPKMVEIIKKQAPEFIKTSSLIAHNAPEEHAISFKEKFVHDRWKKLVDIYNYKVCVEISNFNDEDTIAIETELRDIMRSRKEIPTLKQIAFVWIVSAPIKADLTAILEHYFQENFEKVMDDESKTYIAWSEALRDINMRYFVHTPS